jgi:uncharacterized protein (TIGR01777 family)
MTIVIAGGTGFLGSGLAASFRADGHDVVLLTRRPRKPGDVAWDPLSPSGVWTATVDGAEAVINLAGESLDAGRWTAARKASIHESRLATTRAIVAAMAKARRPPAVLVNASEVGVYGTHGSAALTERSPPGSDFLASVCVAWEAQALEAAWMTRVVLLRTGLALDGSGGALPKLALPFQLFAGGRAGPGNQYWSWIHREDWTRIVRWTVDTPDVTGPVNLTAPAPVTNAEFAQTLGRVLHRPALMPAPAFALRLLLGEMADALILNGQRVLPAKATLHGFEFRYPDLESALRAIYGGSDETRPPHE